MNDANQAPGGAVAGEGSGEKMSREDMEKAGLDPNTGKPPTNAIENAEALKKAGADPATLEGGGGPTPPPASTEEGGGDNRE